MRFSFGKNWKTYLEQLSDSKIQEAEKSLVEMLSLKNLKGKTFLDIGSGSGLFSLAARKLGATVTSFDYDKDSVECTTSLREKYFPDMKNWIIEKGSILDKNYLKKFKKFDIVYSWGVLHHTGEMWNALENISGLVKKNGLLFIAIYNDQGDVSRRWLWIKKFYNSGSFGRILTTSFFYLYYILMNVQYDMRNLRNPFKRYEEYQKSRGMSYFVDIRDWIGGYPFEVAKPEEIFEFFYKRKFQLVKLKTVGGGLGCNEFVFRLET